MPKSQEELIQETNDLLRGLANSSKAASPGVSGGSIGSSGGSSWNPLTTAANAAADAISLLGKNSGYAAGAVDALGKVASYVPGVGDAMQKMTNVAGEHLISGTKRLQDSMNVGNLQQNLGAFTHDVSKSRMSMDEWMQSTHRGADAMTSIGSTVTRGQSNFAALSEELQQSKIGEQMRQAGFSNKEMNDMLLITAKNNRKLNLDDANARKELINSAGELSLKIQEVSAVTGQSKSALVDKLDAEKKDAQLIVARQHMEPAQRAAFDNFRVSLNKLGPEVAELAKGFQTGGIRTPEQRAIFSAMGTLGPELQRVQKMQLEAGKDPTKRAAADEAQRNFEARYFQYLQSKGVEQRVNVDKSAAGDALRRMVVAGQEAGSGIASGQRETPKATGAQVIAGQQRETALAVQGRDVTGKRIAEAQPYRTVVATEQAGRDINAGVGLKVKELNTEINTSTGLFTKLNNSLKDILAPRTTEQAAKVVEKPAAAAGDAIKQMVPAGKASAPNSGLPADYKPGSRWSGSLGAVGKLLEDFGTGTPMMLHGKEGVITEKQLNDVVGTVKLSSDKEAAAATIQSAKHIIDTIGSRMSGDTKDKNFNVKDMIENTKQLATQAKQPAAQPAQPMFDIPKTPPVNTAVINDQFKGLMTQIGQMQSSVKTKLAESKNLSTANELEKTRATQTLAKSEPKHETREVTKAPTERTDAMSDLVKGIEQLNMRMERLITEVSNGTSKQVKATKNLTSNRIAT